MPNPRKPTALKKIQGTIRKDRTKPDEWKPESVITFPVPDELNEWGSALWSELMEEFKNFQILARPDYGTLLILCNEYGTYMEADDLIKVQGLQVEVEIYNQRGEVVGTKTEVNPMIKVRNESARNYQRMMTEFGLSPASRGKISAKPVEEKDTLGELMKM